MASRPVSYVNSIPPRFSYSPKNPSSSWADIVEQEQAVKAASSRPFSLQRHYSKCKSKRQKTNQYFLNNKKPDASLPSSSPASQNTSHQNTSHDPSRSPSPSPSLNLDPDHLCATLSLPCSLPVCSSPTSPFFATLPSPNTPCSHVCSVNAPTSSVPCHDSFTDSPSPSTPSPRSSSVPSSISQSRKERKKNKKKKRKTSKSEDGKKIFVGGIGFEHSEPGIADDDPTISFLRTEHFSKIFLHFGKVKRVQGHWNSGYCFVVFSKRQYAKQAIKYLTNYSIRKKITKDMRAKVLLQGVLPLPSFYVRWPLDSKFNHTSVPSSPSSSSSFSSSFSSSLSSSSVSSASPSPFSLSPKLSSTGGDVDDDVELNENDELDDGYIDRLLRNLRLQNDRVDSCSGQRDEDDEGGCDMALECRM